MTEESTMDRIKSCVEHVLEHSLEQFPPGAHLQDDMGMESMELVLLQVELEQEFQVTFDPITDNFFEIFQTVDTLCSAIDCKLATDRAIF